MDSAAQLAAIDNATLSDVVKQALHSDTVEITSWQYQRVYGGVGVTTHGLYRVSGTGVDQGRALAWSLMLKVVRPPADAVVHADSNQWADSSHWSYWKREFLTYQDGLLRNLPGGVSAPECLGCMVQPDGSLWLWLEEVTDTYGHGWPLACYGLAAQSLGHFNGAYLAERPVPSASWLAPGWLRDVVSYSGPIIRYLPSTRDHALVRRLCPPAAIDRILRLMDDSATFLDALDSLPQVFCHLDAWRRNLFLRRTARGTTQTVVIDWAYAGIAALGAELGAFVAGPAIFFVLDPSMLRDLDELAFDSYVDGLRNAGWRGDLGAVRFGYTATAALRWVLGFTAVTLRTILDTDESARMELALGHSVREQMDRAAVVLEFLLRQADEARALLSHL